MRVKQMDDRRHNIKILLAFTVALLLAVFVAACGGSDGRGQVTSASAPAAQGTSTGESTKVTDQKRPPQNDDYIATYGREAVGVDDREITHLVKRYYAAVAVGDGVEACSLLYPPLARSVPEDYGRRPGPLGLRGKTCAAVMSKLSRNVAGQSPMVLSKTRVTGVRVRGNRGFVQLTSSAMRTGEIFVERQRGRWKVAVLMGRACTGCSAG